MKKILFLLICTFLVGCCVSDEKPDPIEIGDGPIKADMLRPYQFNYNGHKYIYFSGNNGSIVHDPDCSCKKESSIW